jgi:hypothetical protein
MGDLHGASSFFFVLIVLCHSVVGYSFRTGPDRVSLDTKLGFATFHSSSSDFVTSVRIPNPVPVALVLRQRSW